MLSICYDLAACNVLQIVGLPGQLSARLQMSYEKAFLLQKEAGQPYDFCGVADWPTFV